MKCFRYIIVFLFPIIILCNIFSNSFAHSKDYGENFTTICKIDATPVKNQGKSFTCWSYTVISMIESELLASGKGEYNLSEMFVVYQAYLEKAEHFVRMHGTVGFGGGEIFSWWDGVKIIAAATITYSYFQRMKMH